MEFEEAKDSVKDWFNERLKNPYFASVLAVWLVTNRVVVFGLFNFHEDQTLQDRVTWVHQQLSAKEVWIFSGFSGIILYSFLAGLIAMIVFNYINVTGKIVYNVLGRGAISLLKWLEPIKWVPVKDMVILRSEFDKLNEELEKKKSESLSFKQERDVALNSIGTLTDQNTQMKNTMSGLATTNTDYINLQHENSELQKKINELTSHKEELTKNLYKFNPTTNNYEIEISNFLSSPYADYFENIMTSITSHKPLNKNVPQYVVDFYHSNGIISLKDNLYIITPKGEEYYKAYLKIKRYP